MLEGVIERSSKGWDYTVEGLIKLGFVLLDQNVADESVVGSFILGKTDKSNHTNNSELTTPRFPNCYFFNSHIDFREVLSETCAL